MKHSFILLVMITFGVIFLGHTATAQITFAIPPKVYPAKVPFRCDAGVDRYWHVTSITCTGRANGGYKFRIKGMAQKTSRSLMIDLFYLMPGNRIKTAGTYYFPQIEEGKPFSFEIVSAFSGYAPSRFNGFLISSEVLQKSLLREQEVRAVADNRSESGTDESVVKGEEVTPEPEKPEQHLPPRQQTRGNGTGSRRCHRRGIRLVLPDDYVPRRAVQPQNQRQNMRPHLAKELRHQSRAIPTRHRAHFLFGEKLRLFLQPCEFPETHPPESQPRNALVAGRNLQENRTALHPLHRKTQPLAKPRQKPQAPRMGSRNQTPSLRTAQSIEYQGQVSPEP